MLLSLIVMGVFFWSTAILQQQKKAWAAAAKKLGFVYNDGGRYMASPSLAGTLGEAAYTLATDQLRTDDAQGQRSITAIEVEMGPGMRTTAVLAMPNFATLLAPVEMAETLTPEEVDIVAGTIIKTADAALLRDSLTVERRKTLQALFGLKNAQVLWYFSPENCIVRIETTDPLTSADKVEKLVRRLAQSASVLRPRVGRTALPSPDAFPASDAPPPAA